MQKIKQVYEKRKIRMSEEELRKHLTKVSKEVITRDDLLIGKKALEKKSIGKRVKGGNNYLLGRALGKKYK